SGEMDPRGPFRAPPEAPPRDATPITTICTRCGVVAPAKRSACEVCNAPFAEVRGTAPTHSSDAYWVGVRVTFTCRQCSFEAPPDSLDTDGAVECIHCNLRQKFDVDQWREALEHAHAVGDLAGPWPEGRAPHPTIWIGGANPHKRVGDTTTFASTKVGALT